MKRGRPKGSKNKKSLETIVMDKAIEGQSSIDSKMESIEYKTLRKVYELQFDLSKAHDAIYLGFIIISIMSLINIVIVISK